MRTRRIGDVEVSAIGLGAMPMSSEFGKDRQASLTTVHAALEAGVTLIDTADAYCTSSADFGDNERFVAEVLAAYPGDTSAVLVATKGGHTRDEQGAWGLNGDPGYLKQACDASLKRLGVDVIGLYQFHRPDPRVPIGDSVSALRDLLDAGKIRYAGVSNFNPAEIRQANEILGGRLVSVQNQYSPPSAPASRSWRCAPSWASRSCPGARWAASPRRPSWAAGSPPSPRSPTAAG